ncbi:MAG: RibD family protein [Bacteroidia bacterium]|nr:RibD family protein [Bacteroidia bacterium]
MDKSHHISVGGPPDAQLMDAWKLLLDLRQFVVSHPAPDQVLCVEWGEGVRFLPDSKPDHLRQDVRQFWIVMGESGILSDSKAMFSWEGSFSVNANLRAQQLPEATLLQAYLPYALLAWQAAKIGRCFTVAHFAQSLDGKIATLQGHSRWIGNDENLLHAHRMRALCDGILIGKGTLTAAQPSLTVRHVEGPNPQRIVLSSSPCNFDSLLSSSSDQVWWAGMETAIPETSEVCCLDISHAAGSSDCEKLLHALYEKGVATVYVEGGSATTSAFLAEGMIDILQFHISPLLFGSGIPGISLPDIASVEESVTFEQWCFLQAGDAVMFVGKPKLHGKD